MTQDFVDFYLDTFFYKVVFFKHILHQFIFTCFINTHWQNSFLYLTLKEAVL